MSLRSSVALFASSVIFLSSHHALAQPQTASGDLGERFGSDQPGCYVKTPSTTKNECSVTWTRDQWGETHHGAGTHENTCLGRKAAYDSWCGASDTQMHFIQGDPKKCNPSKCDDQHCNTDGGGLPKLMCSQMRKSYTQTFDVTTLDNQWSAANINPLDLMWAQYHTVGSDHGCPDPDPVLCHALKLDTPVGKNPTLTPFAGWVYQFNQSPASHKMLFASDIQWDPSIGHFLLKPGLVHVDIRSFAIMLKRTVCLKNAHIPIELQDPSGMRCWSTKQARCYTCTDDAYNNRIGFMSNGNGMWGQYANRVDYLQLENMVSCPTTSVIKCSGTTLLQFSFQVQAF